MGFTGLPIYFPLVVAALALAYLGLVEMMKRLVFAPTNATCLGVRDCAAGDRGRNDAWSLARWCYVHRTPGGGTSRRRRSPVTRTSTEALVEGFTPEGSFGPAVAASYDSTSRGDEDGASSFLANAARGRRALEFAIGTGRIAVPLVSRGTTVDGIELSSAMVEVLRQKPLGQDLDVWVGDMTTTRTGREYGLVYLVFNTIFNVLTQDGQVACFENAARHLDDEGVFVVEAAVPSAWLPSESYVRPERVDAFGVTLDVCTYDPVTQILDENHVRIAADGIDFGPISCRLAWPSELDLMARLAGLRLVERWGGWQKQPYTGRDMHVSVYARA